MKRIPLFIFILLFNFQLSAQLGNYSASGEVKIVGQRTSLTISTTSTEVKTENQAATSLVGSLLSPIVDIFVKGAQEKAKQNVAKFQSSFVVNASGSAFWADETHVNLPTLTIERKVILKGSSSETDAMKITLTPELSPDKTAFRLVAKTLTFPYSAAKTRGDFDYIDISLDIKFKALIVDKTKYESKDLRATNVTITMVKAGATAIPSGTFQSGWLPLLPIPTLEIETDVTEKSIVTTESKGTKDAKPVDDKMVATTTTLKKKAKDVQRLITNAGNYEFEVTVNQSNPYKSKAENKQKMIEASSDGTSTLFKTLIEALFKKKEKEEEEQ